MRLSGAPPRPPTSASPKPSPPVVLGKQIKTGVGGMGGFGAMQKKGGTGLAIKLGGGASKTQQGVGQSSSSSGKKKSVASVFGEESSSDSDEEIPAEARMRMRNVGRETITSAGPNSFGKTKHGFVDAKKLFERQMQEAMDEASGDKK